MSDMTIVVGTYLLSFGAISTYVVLLLRRRSKIEN